MKPFGLSGEIDLKVKVKLQVKLMIAPTPLPSAAWGKSYPCLFFIEIRPG